VIKPQARRTSDRCEASLLIVPQDDGQPELASGDPATDVDQSKAEGYREGHRFLNLAGVAMRHLLDLCLDGFAKHAEAYHGICLKSRREHKDHDESVPN
jgi:hypothetical protein